MSKQKKQKRKTIFLYTFPLILFVLLGCLNHRKSEAEYNVGDKVGSIVVDGLKRTYLIHIPASFNKIKSMPLLIAMHGGGGSGINMERLTLGGFNKLANKEEFIVVYPDAIGRHWNDGRNLTIYYSQRENVDDVGFISALIDHLAVGLNIDRKRVYVAGISNGAMMAYRLACELSKKIAAIASVAGSMSENLALNCSPSKAISVLVMHGMNDPLIPFDGGEVHFGRLMLGRVLSISDTVKYWVNYNKCSYDGNKSYLLDIDPNDGTRVWKKEYHNHESGTEVILYGIEGGGHTWPGGYQYLPERIIGKSSKDIDASKVIWNFFKRHSKG